MKYLFGDGELAARRLEVLARVYESPTRAFLNEMARGPSALVIDLGCGPGFTTHLLADALEAERAVGLDNSNRFISLAEKTATERVSFTRHDVRRVPFPPRRADVIYCRYLLTHLREPLEQMEKWMTQLTGEGRLLVEEANDIQTDVPAFRTYLDIVEAMLRSRGNELYIGPRLGEANFGSRVKTRINRDYRYRVDDCDAATLFSMNLPNWRSSAYVRENCTSESIDRLTAELGALRSAPRGQSNIEWRLRQVALEMTDKPNKL